MPRRSGRSLIRAGGATGSPLRITLRPSFRQAHNLRNLLAAVAAARALGVTPDGSVRVRFSALRGERLALAGGVVLINDCYNANPMSMRAAIDDLAETAPARRVAVLGDMLELGPAAPRFHREIGEHAAARGVELLVTVGPLAAEMGGAFAGEAHSVPDAAAAAELLGTLLRDGDTVLVKGSRGVGLERVAEALGAGSAPTGRRGEASVPAERRPGGADGPGSLRRHRGAAHLHLPEPEVHRVPARARVRPAHPRGRPGGPPPEGGHADDGRRDHLPGGRRSRS